MLKIFNNSLIPVLLQKPTLVDSKGLPRFWATIWQLYLPSDLARSTIAKQLAYVESFYQFADQLDGPGALDNAIANIDLTALGTVLESFFISIQNQPITTSSEAKWNTVMRFVGECVTRLSKSSPALNRINEIDARIARLNLLYKNLRIKKRKTQEPLRSLPADVIDTLYQNLDPQSANNPFRNNRTKWRYFVIFVLLLHQGLRRGEVLSLALDFIKSGTVSKTGEEKHWMSIRENHYEEDDSRYSRPSIKTASSIRQIPVSQLTADIIRVYVENYRGKPEHSFLLNSQHNTPLSAESVTKMFQKISCVLNKNAMKELGDRTGKSSISAHDLRHTCAVIRLHQLLNQGDSMDEALQKLRAFFGWSRSSDMPRKYARAVFEDRLAAVWNNVFDERLTILRSISGKKNAT